MPRCSRLSSVLPEPSHTPIGPQTYVNTKEAARIVRLSPRTLERLRTHGTGPRYLKPGRGARSRVLYRVEDLEAWVEATPFASTSEYGLDENGGRR